MPRPKPILIDRERAPRGRAGEVAALLNLGPKTAAWLDAAGIHTRAQIVKLGPIGVCRRLLESGRPVNVLMAYAVEGGLSGTHWNALSAETKQWLRTEFARMRAEVQRRR
ncbi:MAG: TfoX/Sxy family DNA transformation protein [Candidatus Didemnitutus sp.]|nr:TfoX/Sxy family DNA transformation protein [Candidatus Didemnitutus sp.]